MRKEQILLWGGAVVVALAAALGYVNAVPNNFTFDDRAAVVGNADVNPRSPLRKLLYNDYWGQEIALGSSHKSYRPFTVLVFRGARAFCQRHAPEEAFYRIGNETHPYQDTPEECAPVFHTLSLVLNTLASLLVYSIPWSVFRPRIPGYPRSFWLVCSFAAGLLFAVHPIHTEAVANSAGSADVLCAVFAMLAFHCYARAATKNRTKFGWLVLSQVLTLIAALCKELGVVLSGVFVVYDAIFGAEVCPPLRRALRWLVGAPREEQPKKVDPEPEPEKKPKGGNKKKKARKDATVKKQEPVVAPLVEKKEEEEKTSDEEEKKEDVPREELFAGTTKQQWVHFFIRVVFTLCVALAFFMFRESIAHMKDAPHSFRNIEAPLLRVNGTELFLSVTELHWEYFQRLIYPVVLSADWSYNAVPLVFSFSDPRNLGTLALYTFAIALLLWSWWRLKGIGRAALLMLAWYVCTFLPASNIFFFVGTQIGERLLYVPSVAYCLWVGMLMATIFTAAKHVPVKVLVSGAYLAFCGHFMYRTVKRNPDWESNDILFPITCRDVPQSAKAIIMCAQQFHEEGDYEKALDYIHRGYAIAEDFCDLNLNKGVALVKLGRVQEGFPYLTMGLDCPATRGTAARNLLGVYQEMQGIDPKSVWAANGIAEVYEKAEDYENAAIAYYQLANLLLDDPEQQQMAPAYFNKAKELDPTNCMYDYSLAFSLDKVGGEQLRGMVVNLLMPIVEPSKCPNYWARAVLWLEGLYESLPKYDPARLHENWPRVHALHSEAQNHYLFHEGAMQQMMQQQQQQQRQQQRPTKFA